MDYKKYTNISSNSYTAPSDGFVLVCAIIDTNTNNSAADVSIDGTTVFHTQNARDDLITYNVQYSSVFPVSKGSKVTFSLSNGATWSYRRFIPVNISF